jgi:hypothetical protein
MNIVIEVSEPTLLRCARQEIAGRSLQTFLFIISTKVQGRLEPRRANAALRIEYCRVMRIFESQLACIAWPHESHDGSYRAHRVQDVHGLRIRMQKKLEKSTRQEGQARFRKILC